MTYEITIDMDKRCASCGKTGAVSSQHVNGDLCLRCIRKRLECVLLAQTPSRKRVARSRRKTTRKSHA